MIYVPERGADNWLVKPLEKKEDIPLSGRALHVRQEIYQPEFNDGDYGMDVCYRFCVGNLVDDYYQIDRRFLGIEYDLFIHHALKFRRSMFVAETNIPIFRGFNDYGFNALYVGGDHPDALPEEVFKEMLRQFPNTYELKKYARARVSSMLRSYIPIKEDHEAQYLKYRQRKKSAKGYQPQKVFACYETDKFALLVEKIEGMLVSADTYSESQWQAEILQVIQFLYPKYVCAFPEAPVMDSLAGKHRKIDFLLVDASGYVDAIEIKKPFSECLVTSNRYRDNHVPMRELSGTIMQLEKYLYHLSRWGQTGEERLNDRYSDQLPNELRIKIVNPSGMIIMGRDAALSPDQRTDFEVIRRKFRHVVEIMTYDDLLHRLKVIRAQFKCKVTL
ncbi:Shedu immune nuclease family protein [Orrella marina]|nr:Shedu immune nuclease family protein [Orrella marina]